jgi:hypothetical protein
VRLPRVGVGGCVRASIVTFVDLPTILVDKVTKITKFRRSL